MAYIDELFPDCISFGGTGGPAFNTTVVRTNSGAESRNQVWEYPLAGYQVSHDARTIAYWEPLIAFFYNACGRANTWRLWDPLDHAVTSAQGRFVVIDSTHAQLVKRYTFGSVTFDRPITKPKSTISITGGTTPTVDYATGIVTHAGIPTSWSGDFYVHCRFDVDRMEHDTINKQGDGNFIVGWRSIPIVEVRE